MRYWPAGISKYPPAYFCLLLFILTLPLFEAPKTVFLLLFFALCICDAYKSWKKRTAPQWRGDDALLLCWMLSGYVVALFAGIHYKEWGGGNGPMQLALLLLCLKRAKLDNAQLRLLLLAILCSTLLANLEGFWQLFNGFNKALELKSVGHVNHSAIYLGLNFALALAMTLTLGRSETLPVKCLVIAALLLTAVSIVLSNSRSTLITMGVITLFFGLMWMQRSKLPILLLSLSLAIAASGLYFGHVRVVQKHLQQTANGPFLGERGPIWNSALLAWRQFPLFGLGIKNYGQATAELQQQWLAKEGKQYLTDEYLAYAHAHNFYLTTLAEQGLFGLGITLLVLFRVGWLLYRHRPRREDDDLYWAVWLAAAGALQVVLVNGVFNTTLHHEHGLLTMLLLGLWWSRIGAQNNIRRRW